VVGVSIYLVTSELVAITYTGLHLSLCTRLFEPILKHASYQRLQSLSASILEYRTKDLFGGSKFLAVC
jgi:hypothetical protein